MLTKYTLLLFVFKLSQIVCELSNDCIKLDVSITQKVEHQGYHREIKWLLETNERSKKVWLGSRCNLALRQSIPSGLYVDPDQIAEVNHTGKLALFVVGDVDIEKPAHEANGHLLYVFVNASGKERVTINVPVHLRYHRGQLTGGFSKVVLEPPSMLLHCPNTGDICGKGLRLEAPCADTFTTTCIWRNVTYERLFEPAELFVPIGDLDHYPVVAVTTLLLGCAGCIYVLSILSNSAL